MTQSIILPRSMPRERTVANFSRFLLGLSMDKAWRVEVHEHKRTRSDAQNNALWGVAYKTLQRETGNDPDDMHEYFCGEFFGWVQREMFGKVKLKPRRTTTRNEDGKRDMIPTTQFMDFYAFIQRRSAETVGVYIPDPNEGDHG